MNTVLNRLAVTMFVLLSASVVLGFAAPVSTFAESVGVAPTVIGPKYPLVTLEIPPVVDEIGAPAAVLSGFQDTVIQEISKKNFFAGVLSGTDVLEGVLMIQGTVSSWEGNEASGTSAGGILSVQLAIYQKIIPCPFNRVIVKGVVSPEMLKTGSVEPDHELVKGTLAFLTSVTGDE